MCHSRPLTSLRATMHWFTTFMSVQWIEIYLSLHNRRARTANATHVVVVVITCQIEEVENEIWWSLRGPRSSNKLHLIHQTMREVCYHRLWILCMLLCHLSNLSLTNALLLVTSVSYPSSADCNSLSLVDEFSCRGREILSILQFTNGYWMIKIQPLLIIVPIIVI